MLFAVESFSFSFSFSFSLCLEKMLVESKCDSEEEMYFASEPLTLAMSCAQSAFPVDIRT